MVLVARLSLLLLVAGSVTAGPSQMEAVAPKHARDAAEVVARLAKGSLRRVHRLRREPQERSLTASIQEGHFAARGLAHLANASYRLGRTLHFDPATENVVKDDAANHLLRDGDRGYRKPFVVPEHV